METSWSPEAMDAILDRMNERLEGLRAAIEAAPSGQPSGSPSTTSVARKKALFSVFEPVDQARDFMTGLLEHETGTKERPQLQLVFGGDCHRIAHVRAVLEMLGEMLQGSHMAKADRMSMCLKRCEAVESVLRDSGLGASLAKAQEDEKGKVQEILTPAAIPASVSSSSLTPASPSSRLKYLQAIDEAESANAVLRKIDRLFDAYDADGNGLLEGDNYEQAINDLSQYMLKEAQERMEKYGKGTLPPESLIRQWVTDVVDPNNDGAITREEARIGFKQVVDDIETGKDYERRRSSLPSVP